jgi:uncharacterized protein YacL (UPF0231 family)
MAKTHKTITLCQDSREIAENLQNFSAFVRECLLAHQHRGSYAQMGRTIAIWMRVSELLAREISLKTSEEPQTIINHCLIEARAEIKQELN